MIPTFVQKETSDPLYILEASFQPEMAGYTIAFWPHTAKLDKVLTLPQSWQDGGVYLFLGAAPTSQALFIVALADYLRDPAYPGATFLWIANPNDPPGQWQSSRIGLQNGVTISFSQFAFHSISLFLGQQCAVSLNAGQDGFAFTLPAGAAYLTAMSGSAVLPDIISPLTISFAAADAGCLLFEVILDNSGTHHAPDFDRLDVGCRFFANDPLWPDYGRLSSWRYPIFDPAAPAADGLQLAATLDPLNPLLPERTFLSFLPGPLLSGPTLPSFYVTNIGHHLALTPTMPSDRDLQNVPRLVLAVRALTKPAQPYDPVYLTPAGLFTISVLATKTRRSTNGDPLAARMLCGSSGLEYLGLAQMEGNLLSFFPGQPAYAPMYPKGGTGQAPLTTVATTSWGFVVGPQASGLNYFAQPDQAPLFQTTNTPGFLSFLEMSAATLPSQVSTAGQPPTMFPLVAFLGLEEVDNQDYQRFETLVLSPLRRQIISQLAPARTLGAGANGPITAVTPQGLLATFDPALTITLASSQNTQNTTQQLSFSGVQGPLFDAFQSNQLFLVISSKADLQKYATLGGSLLSVVTDSQDAWQFDIFNGWDEHQTIAIFKFHDRALSELVADSTTWISADIFNTAVSTTQQHIQTIIRNAQATELEFAYFVNTVVKDPAWNGILFLNCKVPLNGLPDQIAGIAAGIDTEQFFAHHIGINASKINVPTARGDLSISNSSIFGLINYTAPPLQPSGADYQFQVEQLNVLFLNSTVAAFSSVIDLEINTLFGEPTLEGSSNNIVQMYGVYEKHIVNEKTQGSYSFQTRSGQAFVFDMTSNILNAVQFSKGQFITVSSTTSTDSQFVFWGLLDFKSLEKFDIFSFGRESTATTPSGLSFGNLVLEMTFDPTANPPEAQFAFDASQLSFDLASSVPRMNSFFNHFPLKIDGFTQAKQGTTPTDLGYMGVQTPLTQSSLAYPWYSLNFNLNLGSSGALAAQAGFEASLTAAWSPNLGPDYTVFTGLKLPGSSGAKREISIEGLFNITFKTLEIIVLPNDAFILVLYDIGFKFLSFTFPPTGQVNFVLFGDPKGGSSLGWYAAYAKPDAKGSGGSGVSGLLARPSTHVIEIERRED